MRPPALPGWLLASWFGRTVLHCFTGVLRVQIFDRAMTLAAQAFTSIFPLLIMLGTLLGTKYSAGLADSLDLPETSRRLLTEALTDQGISPFGVVSGLIVLVSATGLARAMVRTYAAVWDVGKVRSGVGAAARWVVTVLMLSAFAIISKLSGHIPLPQAALLVADTVIAVTLPMMLLGGAVPARRLIPGGLVFGVAMLFVRPAGHLYLPRALRASDERYGTIGLAFTYIGWLYVISFCLIAAAVIGQVLAADPGPAGRMIRGETRLSVAIRGGQFLAVHRHRVQRDQAEADGDHRPDRIDRHEGEIDQQGHEGQPDRGEPGPDPPEDQGATDHHQGDPQQQVHPPQSGQAYVEQQV
ncbi:hypothetical protein Ato02nite_077390 [Paractinoplanes toevensis]|uniref:Uncharacterized protein n=1 Tax=Paractinoplanes toevensis TaxID=571911 RepID=A0A919W976_9ACTN|nr:YhjD/YihY/BrkB family envelope integrity protein [Actinoplanes toevensis]GIM95946.1 hypothetical protein Ato02nite_077390 [Actinoplanes toevensis]